MPQLLDKTGLQHYANKMVLAENRKVGSKPLPTALNDIDTAIDEMKTLFDQEYGTVLDMKLTNTENIFSVGQGESIDKRNEVENSFTDIEISGNSLVNCIPKGFNSHKGTLPSEFKIEGNQLTMSGNASYPTLYYKDYILKSKTVYTVIVNVKELNVTNKSNGWCMLRVGDGTTNIAVANPLTTGLYIKSFTTPNVQISDMQTFLRPETTNEQKIILSELLILEGDWTNKSIPQYFEGLKSVGEHTNNKINILSRNKNLDEGVEVYGKHYAYVNGSLSARDGFNSHKATVKSNTNYVLTNHHSNITFWDSNYNFISGLASGTKITTPSNCKYVRYAVKVDSENKVQIEQGNNGTEFTSSIVDKKEISLTASLRGIPNGVKDTIEKVGGEWKVIRRCGQVLLNSTYHVVLQNDNALYPNGVRFVIGVSECSREKIRKEVVCNNFYSTSEGQVHTVGLMFSYLGALYAYHKDCTTVEELKTWLNENPTYVVFQLETPVIEDIDPITLQCWKDGTINIDEILPVETTHTVSLNKPAQIKKCIEELTVLKERVQALEKNYDIMALEQTHQLALIENSIKIDTM